MTPAIPDTQGVLTWADLLDCCSRLHTTRTRPVTPFPDETEMREDSHSLDVLVDGNPARVVPTRMHEPGFYWWPADESLPRRSDEDMAAFKALVDAGQVRRA